MIEIVENFLNPKYVYYLEDLIVSSKLPLYYNKKTVDVDYSLSESFVVLKNAKDSSQFTHHFIRDKEIVSDFWQLVAPINIFLMAKCGVNADMDLDRVKLNLKCQDLSCNKNEHSIPHLDVIDKKGITGIYYVNDSDGDTEPNHRPNTIKSDHLSKYKRDLGLSTCCGLILVITANLLVWQYILLRKA